MRFSMQTRLLLPKGIFLNNRDFDLLNLGRNHTWTQRHLDVPQPGLFDNGLCYLFPRRFFKNRDFSFFTLGRSHTWTPPTWTHPSLGCLSSGSDRCAGLFSFHLRPSRTNFILPPLCKDTSHFPQTKSITLPHVFLYFGS